MWGKKMVAALHLCHTWLFMYLHVVLATSARVYKLCWAAHCGFEFCCITCCSRYHSDLEHLTCEHAKVKCGFQGQSIVFLLDLFKLQQCTWATWKEALAESRLLNWWHLFRVQTNPKSIAAVLIFPDSCFPLLQTSSWLRNLKAMRQIKALDLRIGFTDWDHFEIKMFSTNFTNRLDNVTNSRESASSMHLSGDRGTWSCKLLWDRGPPDQINI